VGSADRDSVGAVVVSNGISNFLNLYNTVLVVRLVLTWFPNTHPAIVGPLRYAHHRTCLYNIDHATALSTWCQELKCVCTRATPRPPENDTVVAYSIPISFGISFDFCLALFLRKKLRKEEKGLAG
jgi:hypothetical protein